MKSQRGEPPILVLAGPTASGKTSLALAIAKRLGGEIVSADSMQVYADLPVLTARPQTDELQGIPYHLTGHIQRGEQYHLQRFVREAEAVVEGIRQRGRLPILCGGTGLYLRGFLRGIFDGPEVDPSIRQELEAEVLCAGGVERLRAELQISDPVAFVRIHPADHVRLIRALEIWRGVGVSITQLQKQFSQDTPRYAHRFIVLRRPVEVLDDRIRSRTNQMLNSGLLEEVASYLDSGGSMDHPVFRALGAGLVAAHGRGEIPLKEMIDGLVQLTRQYAKRQRTWFRSEPGAEHMDFVSGENWDWWASHVIDSLDCPA
jgi:tRNA dimethylallyltransferase